MVIRGHSENDWEQSGNKNIKIAAREHNTRERGRYTETERESKGGRGTRWGEEHWQWTDRTGTK